MCFIYTLLQCIELLGPNCFTQEQYSKLLGLLKDMLEMCFSRASERQAKRQDEDYDEQVEEELEEEVSETIGLWCAVNFSLIPHNI